MTRLALPSLIPTSAWAQAIGACALLTGAAAAWSADSSAAAASALKVLLGPAVQLQQMGSAPPILTAAAFAPATAARASEAAEPTPSATLITVQRGETLDRVIQRALPGVPLHTHVLRKAFVSQNPQAFPNGSPHLMRAGSQLQVPSMASLRQLLINQYPATAPWFQDEPSTGNAQGTTGEHRRWVRFP